MQLQKCIVLARGAGDTDGEKWSSSFSCGLGARGCDAVQAVLKFTAAHPGDEGLPIWSYEFDIRDESSMLMHVDVREMTRMASAPAHPLGK